MRTHPRLVALALATAALVAGLVVGIDGWPGTGASARLVATPDCEAIRSGLIGQPVTAWTSLAFVAGGIWLAGHRHPPDAATRLVFAISLMAVGLGSFVAHAAQVDWARQLDSVAIKLMLVAFVAYPLARRGNTHRATFVGAWLLGSAAVIALQLAWPATARPLLVALAVAALVLAAAQTGSDHRRRLVAGVVLLGAGAAAWWLGRAAGPLCSPESVFQLHGLWHILAAAGIASVYEIYRSEPA